MHILRRIYVIKLMKYEPNFRAKMPTSPVPAPSSKIRFPFISVLLVNI